MKNIFSKILFIALIFNTLQTSAQGLTTPPSGGNHKATVGERIGVTDVTIHYDRPGVKGREGKIWGELVHFGYKDLGFGTSKASPWRGGANENTTIEFSTDVKIEGQPLVAGKYGVFMAMSSDKATVIFSKNATSWGSYFYDAKEDALRVEVKTEPLSTSVEWLKYEFVDQTETAATVALMWEKLKIPFKIEVDLVKTQLESFRRELRGDKGFEWKAWTDAANFCVENKTNLEEALTWANYGVAGVFVGEKNFQTLSCKANVLSALGKQTDADAAMKEALPMGKMQDLHQYGRSLLSQKRSKEAYEVFKMNSEKNPTEFTPMMGMVRGSSAVGDFKKALEFAQKALPKAPDDNTKSMIQTMIPKLQAGKDIN